MIIHAATHTSILSAHAVHLLSVGIPVVMVGLGLALDSMRHARRRVDERRWLHERPLFVAAAACLAAALIHARVTPEHFRESLLYGAFFASLSAAQLGAAWVVAMGRSRRLVAVVAVGNTAVVTLWLVTRLVAIPLGPAAGRTEAFGVLDVAASVIELVAVAACVAALRPLHLRQVTAG